MLTFSISKIRCKIIISLGGTRLSLPVIAALLLAGCGSIDEARTASAAAKTPKVVDVQVLALAEEAIKQKRYKDAKSLIQRILLYDAKNKKAQVLWAEFLLATGKPRDGIKFFEANKDDPALSARALQGMGLAQLWMGENEKAKEHLKQAVAKDPTLWRAWNALGYYYDSHSSWKHSSEAYERAINLNRTSAMLFNNRGYSHLLQQRIKESTDDFTTALLLNPRLKIAQLNLRLAVAWSGQYERALLGGEKKNLPRILNNVGFVALVKGDLVAAEGLFVRAVEADAAYNVMAHKNLYYLKSLKKSKNENIKK